MGHDHPGGAVTIQPGASLQEAIERAGAGGMLWLAAGVWEENITIRKSLTLRGQGRGKSKISGREAGHPVIWIAAPAGSEEIIVRLEGLEIAEARGACADWRRGLCADGLLIQGPAGVHLASSQVAGNARSGISLWDSARVVISSSTIAQNGHYGLWLWNSAYARVRYSVVLENGLGIANSSDPERDGIALRDRAWASIAHSTVARNGHYGLWLADAARARLTTSTVIGNREGGVWLRDGARANIAGSLISENGEGVQLAGRASATLVRNRIIRNRGHGVLLYHSPCYRAAEPFAGRLSGEINAIPGPGEPDGNERGDVCPAELGFLKGPCGGGESHQ